MNCDRRDYLTSEDIENGIKEIGSEDLIHRKTSENKYKQ